MIGSMGNGACLIMSLVNPGQGGTHPGPPNLSGKMKRVSPIFLQDSTIPASQASSSVTCAMRTGKVHHALWYGQYVPAQGLCCGWLAPRNDASRDGSRQLPAGVTPPLPHVAGPLLAKLAQALSAKTGLDFCQTLVNELAHILGSHCRLADGAGGSRPAQGAGEPRHRRQGVCPL